MNYRRGPTRPVSYYAFFKGWLLLSQPPGCFSDPTSFPTKPALRDLSWRSGLFPSRHEAYPSSSDSHPSRNGIWSLVGFSSLVGPLAHPVLYHRPSRVRLALKLFRGEP